ncbi:leucine-rich repeat-containing protein 18 [Brachyistius frenatus]|uniref:leucine-rich repeat-containing protein 18 n=1 Tax=Brachyistius frenatus TaxID=100188 RepID=UPI0037E94777
MANGKKRSRQARGKTVTLKAAQNSLSMTKEGKRRMDLSLKEIAAVPKCIQMCEMDELDLSRNLIRKIPDFIDRFLQITVLDLHSNYLEGLPANIGRLQNLQVLNLCNNRLTSLPDELGLLKKLHTLNLGLNQLQDLPASVGALKDLRQLGLSDNLFTCIPSCLAKLKKLEKVNMARNPVLATRKARVEPPVVSETFYVVKESVLCEDCQSRCQAERRKIEELSNPV